MQLQSEPTWPCPGLYAVFRSCQSDRVLISQSRPGKMSRSHRDNSCFVAAHFHAIATWPTLTCPILTLPSSSPQVCAGGGLELPSTSHLRRPPRPRHASCPKRSWRVPVAAPSPGASPAPLSQPPFPFPRPTPRTRPTHRQRGSDDKHVDPANRNNLSNSILHQR